MEGEDVAALVRDSSQLPVGGDSITLGISKSTPSPAMFFPTSSTLSCTRFAVLWIST